MENPSNPPQLQEAEALYRAGRLAEAQAAAEAVLEETPDNFGALQLAGAAALRGGMPQAALGFLDKAVALQADHAGALFNRGNALVGVQRYAEAVASFDGALALKPDSAAIHANRAVALVKLGQLAAALDGADAALARDPRLTEAIVVRGDALYLLGRWEEAIGSFDRAIAESPKIAGAHAGRGNALLSLKQFAAAIESFDRALALKPTMAFIRGQRLFAKLSICAWDGIESDMESLAGAIEDGQLAAAPFVALGLLDSPRLQKLLTERFALSQTPPRENLGPIAARPSSDKVRVGYFSADFHDHPVPRLMAEVFERHDRNVVEITAFSYGPPIEDPVRERLRAAFDRFEDVRQLSEREIAVRARAARIDVAVDLTGHTTNGRPGIFSFRAAPVQASYIGYLGTMGAPYYDYLIADRVLIPDTARAFYTERIVTLPSYQANDSQRAISEHRYTRAELGLPEEGFVFCCFNNTYKISPETFAGWMRILHRAKDGVLLLFTANKPAAMNLAKEVVRHGIDPARVVFCKALPPADYMARLRAADLFLDTLPYNAGTTASDALWAGLPVLTCLGEAFAGRMAGSLLHAIGLPELITHSRADYEARAVALAQSPDAFARIRQKLADARRTSALFDTGLFTRNLEAAFLEMTRRSRAQLPPADIQVP